MLLDPPQTRLGADQLAPGLLQKIKDAITPGTHKHDEGAVGTGLVS